MRGVEVVDAGDERGDARAQLGTKLGEASLRDRVVVEHPRPEVDRDALLPHRAGVLADAHEHVEEELLGAILGLAPTHGVEASFDRRSVDVRYAPGVAIEHDLALILALPGQLG